MGAVEGSALQRESQSSWKSLKLLALAVQTKIDDARTGTQMSLVFTVT